MRARYIPSGIHTANMPQGLLAAPVETSRALPFVTIAQQIGAEVPDLPKRLAETLGAHMPGAPPWSHWDRELIQKVSEDSRIPTELVESVEVSGHSWIDDLLNGIAGRVDEVLIFHRIRDAVRAVAQSGHAILIGHGSVFITRDLPAGLHIRLIAPMPVRVAHVASRFNLTSAKAARHIRQIERQRQAFFSQLGLRNTVAPETFSAVINTSEVDETHIVRAVVAMLPEQGERATSSVSSW